MCPANRLTVLGALSLALGAPAVAPAQPAQRNILVIVADDLGADNLCRYRGALPCDTGVPRTPELDALMDDGVRFANAWSNPICSTTRSTIQTGQYSRRTNVLGSVGGVDFDESLKADTWTLAEMLDDAASAALVPEYSTAAFGKWHLNTHAEFAADPPAPIDIGGFDYFEGTVANLERTLDGRVGSYCDYDWWRLEAGFPRPDEPRRQTFYATNQTTDSALSWIDRHRGGQPWMVYVAYHAPHDPFHRPALHGAFVDPMTSRVREIRRCKPCDDPDKIDRCASQMIEVLDTEIGYLVDVLRDWSTDPSDPVTFPTILFVSDNGSDRKVVDPLLDPDGDHSKSTVFQSGVRVPFFASQGQVRASAEVVTDFVNTTDLFATVAELAGVSAAELDELPPADFSDLDSISLIPYLTGVGCGAQPCRTFQFTETVEDEPRRSDIMAYRSAAPTLSRYKLVRNCLDCSSEPPGAPGCDPGPCPTGQCLYDLATDLSEQTPVLDQPIVMDDLTSRLDELLVGFEEVCGPGEGNACEWCTVGAEAFCLVKCRG